MKLNLINCLKSIPEDIIALTSRLAIVTVFWRSVQTKIQGWEIFDQSWQFYNLTQTTFILFKTEYALPLLNYKLAAYLATFSEFFLSLTILIGLMTRLSALAFLGMTIVIQLFVFPSAWPNHLLWAAILLYLIKYGAGRVSLDYYFWK